MNERQAELIRQGMALSNDQANLEAWIGSLSQEDRDLLMDGINTVMEPFRQFIQQIYETFAEIAKRIMDAVKAWHENLTRHLMTVRLVEMGVPVSMARWIARSCPGWCLPVRWAWAPLLGP